MIIRRCVAKTEQGGYYGKMSCITIWRTLCKRQNNLENYPIGFLLAYYIPRLYLMGKTL